MKKTLLILSLFSWFGTANAQEKTIQQLKRELSEHPQQDTFRVNRLLLLSLFSFQPLTERIKFTEEALSISQAINYLPGQGYALANMGSFQYLQGAIIKSDSLLAQADSLAKKLDDPELTGYVLFRYGSKMWNTGDKGSLDYFLKAEKIYETSGNDEMLAVCQASIAAVYQTILSNYPVAMQYLLKANESAEKSRSSYAFYWVSAEFGDLYQFLGDYDNALDYFQKAREAIKRIGADDQTGPLLVSIGESYRLSGKYPQAIGAYMQSMKYDSTVSIQYYSESNLADVYTRINNLPLAFQYGFSSLVKANQLKDSNAIAWIHGILGRAYVRKGIPDSSVYYALPGLDMATNMGTIEYMRDNAGALAEAYALKKDFANAYKYHLQYTGYRDSMLNAEVRNRTAVFKYNYDLAKKQAQITQLSQQQKIQRIFLISSLVVLTLIAITAGLLLRNNRQKQKAKLKIESAYAELKSTQAQLVQSEKMASLGELTAGISHEIQNPLNFVNNFSEINNELIAELKNAKLTSETDEEVLNDIYQNNEKIVLHGKRADAIVKGMLEHSRQRTGKKQLTDINMLADEYLKLAFHGMRAKDKNFNALLKTHFNQHADNINIVPQDIGRVLLNLYNNAFYAVNEKARQHIPGYEPTVTVSTEKLGSNIEIKVTDNGNGIPQTILNKIFQPFFTTKPTGQGTGLGLSLAYDMVKSHGGELKAETKENEGSKFIISIPV